MSLLIICLLSKTQISKTIPSGGSFSSCLDNSRKTNIAIYLAWEKLSGLVGNLASNGIHKFDGKVSEKGAVRAEKEGFSFWIKMWIILLKS